SNTVNNSGVIRAADGLLTLSGASSANNAAGSIQAPTGATIFYSQGLATNAGTISLSGGTFDNNALPLNNTGTIDGRGIFRSGGDSVCLSGDLVGRSHLPDIWETSEAALLMVGASLRHLSLTGADLGPVFEGYENHFAWGMLPLGAGNHHSLEGDGALYLREL